MNGSGMNERPKSAKNRRTLYFSANKNSMGRTCVNEFSKFSPFSQFCRDGKFSKSKIICVVERVDKALFGADTITGRRNH